MHILFKICGKTKIKIKNYLLATNYLENQNYEKMLHKNFRNRSGRNPKKKGKFTYIFFFFVKNRI